MNAGLDPGLEPIPVLLYHRIAHAVADPFAVAPERFREHVSVIAASRRTPITIGALAASLRGTRRPPPRPMAITFDDGFEDTPWAMGELAEHGLPATLYVTTGSLDQPGGLSTDQVRSLGELEAAVELGAHTVSHPHLDAVPLSQVRREVRESKQHLESILGRPVDTFAYPHGSYDSSVRGAVIEAGYRSAAAVKNALSHCRDDPWAIARYTITSTTSPERLAKILDGRNAPLAWQHERVRTRAARAARRARRRLAEMGS